jgi:hypothetical protein
VLYPVLLRAPPLADEPAPALLVLFSDFFIFAYLTTAAARSLLSPFDLLASTKAATVGLVSRWTSSKNSLSARTLLAYTRSFLGLPPIGTVVRTFSIAIKGCTHARSFALGPDRSRNALGG